MGHRTLPRTFTRHLGDLSADEYVVCATRHLPTREAARQLPALAQFGGDAQPGSATSLIPAWKSRWVRWNTQGRDLTCYDLPKVSVTRYWEASNFGRPDTHEMFQTLEVWQHKIIHGRSMQLTVNVLTDGDDGVTVTLEADHLFRRDTPESDPDLLMAVSLVTEGLRGTAFPRPSDMTRQEWEQSLQVTWVFLEGAASSQAVFDRAMSLGGNVPPTDRDVMIERIDMIRATNPGRIVVGASGLTRYVGFQYQDDLVALENFTYGNALYLMYEDWPTLSRRSRKDLLTSPTGGYDRIIHTGAWRDVFWRMLRARGHDPDPQI